MVETPVVEALVLTSAFGKQGQADKRQKLGRELPGRSRPTLSRFPARAGASTSDRSRRSSAEEPTIGIAPNASHSGHPPSILIADIRSYDRLISREWRLGGGARPGPQDVLNYRWKARFLLSRNSTRHSHITLPLPAPRQSLPQNDAW